MIAVEGLTVSYGSTPALDGATASCRPGAVVALVGPNGAGKSTLLRTIASACASPAGGSSAVGPSGGEAESAAALEVAAPTVEGARTSGRVRLDRAAIDRLLCDSLVAYCPDSSVSFLDLSPLENADLLLLALGVSGEQRTERLATGRQILDLGIAVDRPVGDLSLGMRKRTDIFLTVLRRSAVYLFDEPYNGLDAGWIRTFAELVGKLAAAGRTVLIASHAVDLLLPSCDALWELDGGSVTSVRAGDRGSFTPAHLSRPEAGQHSIGALSWL